MRPTRQDINYILVHFFMFFYFYTGAMANLHKVNPNFNSFFDWSATYEGLKGMLGASIGINIAGKIKE